MKCVTFSIQKPDLITSVRQENNNIKIMQRYVNYFLFWTSIKSASGKNAINMQAKMLQKCKKCNQDQSEIDTLNIANFLYDITMTYTMFISWMGLNHESVVDLMN